MRIGTIAAAAAMSVGSFVLAAPAMAADLPEIAPVVVETPPPPAPGFSWSGPYVGVFGFGLHFDDEFCIPYYLFYTQTASASRSESECCHTVPEDLKFFGGGIQAGYLFGDRFVFGPEIQIGAIFFDGDPWWAIAANLRAGVVLGERVLVYVEGGVGTTLQPNIRFLTAGGGVEIALGERISVFGEAKGVWLPDAGNAFVGTMVQVGLNFHFGAR